MYDCTSYVSYYFDNNLAKKSCHVFDMISLLISPQMSIHTQMILLTIKRELSCLIVDCICEPQQYLCSVIRG